MFARNPRHHHAVCTGLALALPLAALAACGGGGTTDASAEAGSGKGTISVWAHQGQKSEATAMQNAVKSFNSS
jgi:multiple sugar transport system substrate-binding protein